jgi:hypothetical protein
MLVRASSDVHEEAKAVVDDDEGSVKASRQTLEGQAGDHVGGTRGGP